MVMMLESRFALVACSALSRATASGISIASASATTTNSSSLVTSAGRTMAPISSSQATAK